ncbi:hypothetical protein Ahy_A06g028206 [Arachis hypogaea]|uniref:Glucosamine 6-phosphate N-acetyltransferase n=2 Tax=Arachis TaxID=3817 RepID=A0A445CQI9_ARAHY|nr:hypothetical protein Ahy_A06g028206 [Arachis hypogaea]
MEAEEEDEEAGTELMNLSFCRNRAARYGASRRISGVDIALSISLYKTIGEDISASLIARSLARSLSPSNSAVAFLKHRTEHFPLGPHPALNQFTIQIQPRQLMYNPTASPPPCCFAGSSSLISTSPPPSANRRRDQKLQASPPLQSAPRLYCSSMETSEEQKYGVRRLEMSDKGKGFIELLQQLSVCDSVSDKEFEDRFRELSSLGDDHVICVIEDHVSKKIIATGSVFIEKKFLRNCGKVGHIEDVVVDSSTRGKQLGKKIINFLTDHARSMGCYKVILDCSIENKLFYEKCGFKQKEIQMVRYFV